MVKHLLSFNCTLALLPRHVWSNSENHFDTALVAHIFISSWRVVGMALHLILLKSFKLQCALKGPTVSHNQLLWVDGWIYNILIY